MESNYSVSMASTLADKPTENIEDYEYVANGCSGICACTGMCKGFSWKHKVTGERYVSEATFLKRMVDEERQMAILTKALGRLNEQIKHT